MELTIEKMVYGGSGISRQDDGRVILVPFTLPGEIVSVEKIFEKNGIFSAWPEKIIQPNASRVDSPCMYYQVCGGCHLQHVEYESQRKIKQDIITEQLTRIGGNKNPRVHTTVASKNIFNYRNHVQFHVDSNGKLGFQRAQSHDVIPIEKCLLLEEPINDLLQTLEFESGVGLQRVALRDDREGEPILFLSGDSPNPPEFTVDFPLNVVYRGPAGDISLSGDPFNEFTILGNKFRVSAGSFFQTNRDVAEKLASHLLERMQRVPDSTILDCYCGVGFFSAFLAENAARVIGIESSEDACNDYVINLDRFDNVELYQGNVEAILLGLDIKIDLAVVDPPRAGMAPSAIKGLIKSNPEQIVYISCDPSTLARDMKIFMDAGYRVDEITPFDMFPQTYHIETMVFLSNNH